MASAIVGFLQLVPPSHGRSYLPYQVVVAWQPCGGHVVSAWPPRGRAASSRSALPRRVLTFCVSSGACTVAFALRRPFPAHRNPSRPEKTARSPGPRGAFGR